MPKATPDRDSTGRIRPELRAIKSRYCGASRANRGADTPTCKQPAGYGTDHPGWGHCVWHFGASPSGEQFADRQRTEAIAARETFRLGVPVTTTPEAALADEINRSYGMVLWIQQQLQDWEIGDDGKVSVTTVLDDGTVQEVRIPALAGILAHTIGARIMEAFRDERTHYARVAKAGVDANLVGRQQNLDAKRLDLMDELIRAIITDLGHDPNDNRVRAVVSKRLLGLAAS